MSMANILSDPSSALTGNAVASDYQGRRHPMSAALLQAAAEASAQDSSASPQEQDELEQPSDGEGEGDAEQVGAVDAGGGDGGEPTLRRKKRSRACQACRGMKIRCLPVEGQEACRACSKVNRACVMPGPARKRQKTVHKVAELEKKIDALTKSLAAKNATTNESSNDRDSQERRSNDPGAGARNVYAVTATPPSESPGTMSTPSTQPRHLLNFSTRPEREYTFDALEKRAFPEFSPEARIKASERTTETDPVSNYVDVVTRGVLSLEKATEIYMRWKLEMCPYCPFIVFPDHVTIQWLRQRRPMVLLSILGVACGTIQPDIQDALMMELSRQLADRVMYYCEKSIDLAQALLIFPIWYGKHKEAKDLGFNQYIHTSLTMCLDLGLGKRSKKASDVDAEQDLERRRLWLGCYYLAGSVTTVMRVPSLVKFSPYIQECLDCLTDHASSLPTDRWLCSLVRLNHMYEDIGILFHMDDPGSNIPLNDSRTQYHLKMFGRQLEDWKRTSHHLVPKAVLDSYIAVTSLYIHEIAMHTEHNVDDFRPEIFKDPEYPTHSNQGDLMTNEHFEALTICVDSMESAMLAFEAIDLRILRALPCLSMVWIAYVAVAMIRLHSLLKGPYRRFGEIFLPRLHIERHLDNCIARITFNLSENPHSPADAFLTAFKKLRAWFAWRTSDNNPPGPTHEASESNTHPARGRGADPVLQTFEVPQSPTGNPNANANHSRGTLPSRYSSISQQSQSPPIEPVHRFTALNQNVPRLLPHQTYMANHPHGSNNLNQSPAMGMASAPTGQMLDPHTAMNGAAFDVAWDLNGINTNLTELNNFDVYMNDVGWMGYLM